MSKPITPDEIGTYAQTAFPSFVFDAVNTMLAMGQTKIQQNILVKKIIDKAAETGIELTRNDVFANHYLDFEEAYRAAGWKVFYDKPAYNESYEATFEFSRKK